MHHPSLRRDVRGASLLEYIILVGLIALVALVGFRVFGNTVRSKAASQAACVASLDSNCSGGSSANSGMPGADNGGEEETGAVAQEQQSGAWYWTKGIAKGIGLEAWDTVKGLGELAYSTTPPGMMYYAMTGKPNPAVQAVLGLGKLALSASPPGRMVAMLGGPDPLKDTVEGAASRIKEAWKRDKAEVVGRGIFEVATIVLPVAKAKWAANAAKLANIEKAVDVAKVGELGTAANAINDVTKTAELTRVVSTASEVVKPGAVVSVTRSSGLVDAGWTVAASQDGKTLVQKMVNGQMLTKTVDTADILRQTPGLLKGAEVNVMRSSGQLENGWKVADVLPNGKVRVTNGVLQKDVTMDELLQRNPQLAGQAPPPVFRPPARDVGPLSGPGRASSELYNSANRVEGGTKIADGFADGGRSAKVGADGRMATSYREVIVVDRARDAKLAKDLEYARSLRGLPPEERAQKLAQYVDQRMNPAAGRGASEQAVEQWEQGYKNKEVLIGDVGDLGGGVCRHRALMYKVLGDEAGLDVALQRGKMNVGGNLGAHAWNDVRLPDGRTVIVDVMNPEPGFRLPTVQETGGLYYSAQKTPIYLTPTPPPNPFPNKKP